MIATYVSSANDCYFCQTVHGAVAAHHLGGDEQLVRDVKLHFESAAVSDKLKALLTIAGKVQQGGKHVTTEDVARARQQGATDKEIHDTVLIAAAFCMYNRYVDGLGDLGARKRAGNLSSQRQAPRGRGLRELHPPRAAFQHAKCVNCVSRSVPESARPC